MIVTALQLTHVLPAFPVSIVGLKAEAVLISEEPELSDYPVPVRTLILTRGNTRERSYIMLTSGLDAQVLSSLSARVANSTIQLTLLALDAAGQSIPFQQFDLAIADFRYDWGPVNASVTLVSTDRINIPASAPVTLTRWMSKMKLSGDPGRFIYGVNPIDYRYYGIGSAFSEGDVTGTITKSTLSLTPQRGSLTLEVTP